MAGAQCRTNHGPFGRRSDPPMHLNTQYDLYYIRNYSLWLDVKILLKTVVVVARGQGAY